MYSPKWLFLYPGLIILIISSCFFGLISIKPINARRIILDVHTLTYCGAAIILSFQLIVFFFLSRVYAINQGLLPISKRFLNIFKYFSLERGLIGGMVLFLIGLALGINLFLSWQQNDFGHINNLSSSFRILIPSVILIIIGIQTIFLSFLYSIIGIIQNIKYLEK